MRAHMEARHTVAAPPLRVIPELVDRFGNPLTVEEEVTDGENGSD